MEEDEQGDGDGEFQDENSKFYQLKKQFLHTIEQSDNLNNEKEKLKSIIDNFMEESDELKTDWHSARAESGKKKRLLKKLEERLEETKREKDLQVNEKEKLSESISELNQDLLGFIDEVNQFGESSESSDSVQVNGEILKTLKASVFRRFKDYQKEIVELKKNQKESNVRLESVSSRLPEGSPGPPASTVVAPHSASSSQDISTEERPVLHPPDPHMADPSKRLTCVCTLQFKSDRELSIHLTKWPCLCGTLDDRRTEYIEHQRVTQPLEEPQQASSTNHRYSSGIPPQLRNSRGRSGSPSCGNSTRLYRPEQEAEPVASTSRGPSIVIPTRRCNTPERRPTSSTFGDEAAPDVKVDAHLTFEPTIGKPHEVDESQSGFFCKCGMNFEEQHLLKKHIYYMSLPRKLICQTCEQKFSTSTMFKDHMLHRHGIHFEEEEECQTCGKTFTTTTQLIAHQRSVHSVRTAPVDIKSQPALNDEPPSDAEQDYFL